MSSRLLVVSRYKKRGKQVLVKSVLVDARQIFCSGRTGGTESFNRVTENYLRSQTCDSSIVSKECSFTRLFGRATDSTQESEENPSWNGHSHTKVCVDWSVWVRRHGT